MAMPGKTVSASLHAVYLSWRSENHGGKNLSFSRSSGRKKRHRTEVRPCRQRAVPSRDTRADWRTSGSLRCGACACDLARVHAATCVRDARARTRSHITRSMRRGSVNRDESKNVRACEASRSLPTRRRPAMIDDGDEQFPCIASGRTGAAREWFADRAKSATSDRAVQPRLRADASGSVKSTAGVGKSRMAQNLREGRDVPVGRTSGSMRRARSRDVENASVLCIRRAGRFIFAADMSEVLNRSVVFEDFSKLFSKSFSKSRSRASEFRVAKPGVPADAIRSRGLERRSAHRVSQQGTTRW